MYPLQYYYVARALAFRGYNPYNNVDQLITIAADYDADMHPYDPTPDAYGAPGPDLPF